MGKLFYYELRKLFSRKLLPVLLLFLFLFNALMVYRESRTLVDWSYTKADIGAVYEDLEGLSALEAEEKLTAEAELLEAVDIWRQWADNTDEWDADNKQFFLSQHGELMNRYADLDVEGSYLHYLKDFYGEQQLIARVLSQVSAVAHYEEYLDGIEETAQVMTSSSLFGNPGTFSYRNILKTPPVYEPLKGTVLPAEDSEGVLLATESRVTDLLLLCLFVILALSMLIGEREDGTLLLIKPTRKGYLETITAKLLVMLVLSVGATLLFYGTDFLLGEILLGLGSMERPLQSVEGFLASPYMLSVGQYLAAFLASKAAAALVFGSLLFCLCTVFRNGVSACLATALALTAEFILYLTIGIHSYLSPLKVVNLVCMADTSWFYGDYLNMNVFGYPVHVVPICMAAGLLTAVVCCVWSLHHYVKENSSLSSENRLLTGLKGLFRRRKLKEQKKGAFTVRMSLFGKELYKIFVMERAWLLLAVFLLFQWNAYRGGVSYRDTDDTFYRQYIKWAEGSTLQETAEKYQAEYDRFAAMEEELRAASKAYSAGTLSYDEYNLQQMEYMAVSRSIPGFQRAVSQYEYVLSVVRSGGEAELFYDTGWNALLGKEGQREDVLNAGKLAFVLAVGLAAVFSVEKTSHMKLLLETCVRGRNSVCVRKYLSCVLYGTAAYVIAYLPRYLTVLKRFGTWGLSCHMQSLSILSDVPFNLTLGGYLLLVGISRYLGMLAAIGLILFLSKKCGNLVQTILLSLLILLLPVFLYLMGLTGEPYLSLLPLMTGYSMYRLTAGRLIYWGVILALGLWFYFQTYEEGMTG